MSTPDMGKAPRSGQARGLWDTASTACILVELSADIKSRLLSGELVTAADYPAHQRPHFHAAMSELRDAMGLRHRWRTKTESAVGDWKLRQRCYYLPREYITRPGGDHE